jgi:hypothetical protein
MDKDHLSLLLIQQLMRSIIISLSYLIMLLEAAKIYQNKLTLYIGIMYYQDSGSGCQETFLYYIRLVFLTPNFILVEHITYFGLCIILNLFYTNF